MGAEKIDVVTVFDPSRESAWVEERMREMSGALSAVAEVEMESWKDPMVVDGVRVTLPGTPLRGRPGSPHRCGRRLRHDAGGAGPGGPWGRDVLGRFTWALSRHPDVPVVAVKRRAGGLQLQSFFEFFRREEAVPPERQDEVGQAQESGGATGAEPGEGDVSDDLAWEVG